MECGGAILPPTIRPTSSLLIRAVDLPQMQVPLKNFTVDNLRFARKSSEILTLADCLTVLQTYRQAFSFPQLTCIYGIFLSQVEYGIFHSQVVKLSSWERKFPHSNQLTLKVFDFAGVWTQVRLEKNTSSCLYQLSYWNRQEMRHFFKSLSMKEREREREGGEEGAQTGQYK